MFYMIIYILFIFSVKKCFEHFIWNSICVGLIMNSLKLTLQNRWFEMLPPVSVNSDSKVNNKLKLQHDVKAENPPQQPPFHCVD